MPRVPTLIACLRVAALWLLTLAVVVGPAGLGVSVAVGASAKRCSVSCPCDAIDQADEGQDARAHDEVPAANDEVAVADDHSDGDPCDNACPDDCPNCHCAPAVAVAVAVALPTLTSGPVARSPAVAFAPIEAPPSGSGGSVFRPPRVMC